MLPRLAIVLDIISEPYALAFFVPIPAVVLFVVSFRIDDLSAAPRNAPLFAIWIVIYPVIVRTSRSSGNERYGYH